MRYLKHFIILNLLIMTALLSGCSSGRRAFSKAEQLESEGRFEEAMYGYADAFSKEPDAGQYRMRFFTAREKAAKQRFKTGNDLFAKQEYTAALAEYQAAAALDPTQGRFTAQAEISARLKDSQQAYREGQEYEKANKLKDANRSFIRALELDPGNKVYQAAQARVSGQHKTKLEGYELNLKSSKAITLKFKDAKLKDVYNIVTQLSGINFIFDESIKDQNVTIYLENATFQQVMDLLASMNKLGRKVLNENTMMIYVRNPEKIKQYEDMILRTFHLNFFDAKKAVNLIRTMIQVRKVYVNEDTNSVVVRDTSDVVDVVERLLDANDVPDPEVILDVEVIEITNKNAENLGLLLSNYNVQMGLFRESTGSLLSNTLTSATSGTPAPTPGINTSISSLLHAFTYRGLGGYFTVPSATYNFGKTLAKGEVLSNPKIRVKNKEKSKFNVGTRVPITTTTLNGTLSQVNVQYVDVGVKVNAEPTIQLNNEIVIKLSLEVSSILSRETVGSDKSTTVVTIGNRNLDTVLSLKDGETSVIGGLIDKKSNNNKTKIFLLGDLPLIGPLLSNNENSTDKSELILAITPHLVRGVVVPQSNLMSFSSGKEDDPSLIQPLSSAEQDALFDNAQKATDKQLQPAGNGNGITPKPSTTPIFPQTPATGETAPSGNPAASTSAMPSVVPGKLPEPLPIPPIKAPIPPQRGNLQFGTPTMVAVGQQFTLEIKTSDVTDILTAPFLITYDPVFVEFISATEGDFLKKDGKPTSFSSSVDSASGTVTISLARGAGAGGVSGSGTLASVVFRAVNQGPAGFGFRNVNFTTAGGKSFAMLPFNTAVEIK